MSAVQDLPRRLAAINRALSSSLDFEELLGLVARSGAELLDAAACLVLLREGEDALRVRASEGVDPARAREFSGSLSEAVLGELVRHFDFRKIAPVSCPVMVDRSLHGILVLAPRSPLDEEELWVLSALSDQAAVALRNARLYEDVLERDRRLAEEVETQRRLARELAAAVGELEAFTYSIAHDLRSPLRAMSGLSELLLEEAAGRLEEAHRGYLERIREAGARMDRLIRDLLAYSRLCRGEIAPTSVDLGSLLDDVVRELDPVIKERKAVVERPEALPSVLGHAPTLRQIFANLLGNALKFVAPGTTPRVRISARAAEGRVRIEVEDNGIGVPPEHHERIFRLFERLHPVEAFPGTGVGLAIVQRGVERMGGRVGLDSRPGQGSRFWIELPAAPASAAA